MPPGEILSERSLESLNAEANAGECDMMGFPFFHHKKQFQNQTAKPNRENKYFTGSLYQ
jgi:hypothetical protein